jgi:hypothetical protein
VGSHTKAGAVRETSLRFNFKGAKAMLVAPEHREKLNRYCLLRKVTQERIVNEFIGEALARLDADPVVGEALRRAEELQRQMDTLLQSHAARAR